jgi:hypothetical protein
VPEELEEGEEEPQPPQGHIRVVYLGPVAPHWEVQSNYGDPAVIDPFRDRTLARLTLLPPTIPNSDATVSASSATPSASTSSSSGTSGSRRRGHRRRQF